MGGSFLGRQTKRETPTISQRKTPVEDDLIKDQTTIKQRHERKESPYDVETDGN